MSYQAVRWAYYDAPVLHTEKGKPDTVARSVLAVLGEHANSTGGNAHPSVLRIRYATGLDERTVERALLRLKRAGLIRMTGRTKEGTRIWTLAMKAVRDASEWDQMVEQAEEIRRLESEQRAARRRRNSCAEPEPGDELVRDAESRTSGTQNPGVRDAESRLSGTERPPNHQGQPPRNHQGLTTPGGTLPPDPLRHPSASPRANETFGALAVAPSPAQDQQGDSLTREGGPLAPIVEIRPGISQEAPYRPPPRWSTRGSDAVAEAMARRAAAREAHQAAQEAQ